MKAKTIVTIVLLLFAGTSIAYLITAEVRSGLMSPAADSDAPEVEKSAAKALQPTKSTASKVVVYYFHGTARCMTCRKFEQYTLEALQDAFAEHLNDVRLQWQMVEV